MKRYQSIVQPASLSLKSYSPYHWLGVEFLVGAVVLQGVEQAICFAVKHGVNGVLAGNVLNLASTEVVGSGKSGGIGGIEFRNHLLPDIQLRQLRHCFLHP